MRRNETDLRDGQAPRRLVLAALIALFSLAGCNPSSTSTAGAVVGSDWRSFEGKWTAAGSRQSIELGPDRKASVSMLRGTLLLSGPERPNVGFRADVVVLTDTATGLIGRAVWTDERGDQAWSELRGEGTATGNRIVGTFLGGTGRYAGISGEYAFSWRFVLESEDGTVQGQSLGLKGRARIGQAGSER
jgi:hypothetical protein